MSTSSLRAMAAVAAAVFALLTGIVTGVVASQSAVTRVCEVTPAVSPSTGGPNQVGTVDPRPAEQGSEAQRNCRDEDSDQFLLPGPAIIAAAGAAVTGIAALALMAMAASRRAPAPVSAPPRPGSAPVSAPVSAPPRPSAALLEHTGEMRAVGAAGAGRVGGDGKRVDQLAADRAALVRAVIYVRDRVTSKALSDRLGSALADAGIATVEPTGTVFDPAQHEAGGAVAATEPAQAGTIAAVEVPGYTDRGRVLRAPVVTVYQAAGTPPARQRSKEAR